MNGRPWPALELEILRVVYPHHSTAKIAAAFGRSASSVNGAADKLGLHKSAEYLASADACRLRRGDNVGAAYRFKKGHVTWNKGKKLPGWTRGRMAETQFKKGQRTGAAARNWFPVGTIRKDREGFLRIKVRESLPTDRYHGFGNTEIWPLLNRQIWQQHHGPIPAGHIVAFKDGDRANCDIANLELMSQAEMMRRNTIHRLPEQLVSVIMLNGALKRKIRRRLNEEHTGGSAQPLVRDDREAEGRREAYGD